MPNIHRSNPALENRLRPLLQRGEAEAFLRLYETLSVSERRTAGYQLAEKILPTVGTSVFWKLFAAITPMNSKAFLMTFVNAFVNGYKQRGPKRDQAPALDFDSEGIGRFLEHSTPIDRKKLLQALLPVLRRGEETDALICLIVKLDEWQKAAQALIHAATIPSYYALFHLLRRVDPESDDIRQVALIVLRGNSPQAHHFAEILQTYFSLEALPCVFAKPTEPYRLARLEGGYENFQKEMAR